MFWGAATADWCFRPTIGGVSLPHLNRLPGQAYESCDTCDYLECGAHVPTQFPAPFDFGWGQQIWNRKVGFGPNRPTV